MTGVFVAWNPKRKDSPGEGPATARGLCACGCGLLTRYGHNASGVPNKYIHGHNARGATNPNAGAGRGTRPDGYVWVRRHGHHRADANGLVLEHWLIAEEAHGRPFPDKAVIHHYDRPNPRALVVCEDQSYHMLVEYRTRALRESGHADWMRCRICKRWDHPDLLYVGGKRRLVVHRGCVRSYQRGLRERSS